MNGMDFQFDPYDFDLSEKQAKAERLARAKSSRKLEVTPARTEQPLHTYKRRKQGVESKGTKKFAKFVKEVTKERPEQYVRAVQEAGLNWEDIIFESDNEGELEPLSKPLPSSDKGKLTQCAELNLYHEE